MDGSSPELLVVMRLIQQVFDAEARRQENDLLDSITCWCPSCWNLYWSRFHELRWRDERIQDAIDDEEMNIHTPHPNKL